MSKRGTNTAFFERVTASGIAVVVGLSPSLSCTTFIVQPLTRRLAQTLDHYPVNSLSREVTNGLTRAVKACEDGIESDHIKGVVLRGAGERAFCAGADISGFGGGNAAEPVDLGRESSDAFGFEELAVPVVAAIQGVALGGGFELSL